MNQQEKEEVKRKVKEAGGIPQYCLQLLQQEIKQNGKKTIWILFSNALITFLIFAGIHWINNDMTYCQLNTPYNNTYAKIGEQIKNYNNIIIQMNKEQETKPAFLQQNMELNITNLIQNNQQTSKVVLNCTYNLTQWKIDFNKWWCKITDNPTTNISHGRCALL